MRDVALTRDGAGYRKRQRIEQAQPQQRPRRRSPFSTVTYRDGQARPRSRQRHAELPAEACRDRKPFDFGVRPGFDECDVRPGGERRQCQ